MSGVLAFKSIVFNFLDQIFIDITMAALPNHTEAQTEDNTQNDRTTAFTAASQQQQENAKAKQETEYSVGALELYNFIENLKMDENFEDLNKCKPFIKFTNLARIKALPTDEFGSYITNMMNQYFKEIDYDLLGAFLMIHELLKKQPDSNGMQNFIHIENNTSSNFYSFVFFCFFCGLFCVSFVSFRLGVGCCPWDMYWTVLAILICICEICKWGD